MRLFLTFECVNKYVPTSTLFLINNLLSSTLFLINNLLSSTLFLINNLLSSGSFRWTDGYAGVAMDVARPPTLTFDKSPIHRPSKKEKFFKAHHIIFENR
jgi:hypothetical protein